MHFRILGDITDAETIATYLAVRLSGRSYTGTRRRESGVASSRLSASC